MKNLEKYLINFDELKVGDTVWSAMEGDVPITLIKEDSHPYPIKTVQYTFSKMGYVSSSNKLPTLFKSNPFEELKEEPRMIEVFYNPGWIEKELLATKDGIAVYWDNHQKEVYTTTNWREIQPEVELTDKERIAQLEKEIERLKKKFKRGKYTPKIVLDE